MAPKSQAIMDNRSAAEKRRDTINKKKLEEQAQLRQIEAAGKVNRSSKLAAMKEAPWKGAAPTGPHKRGASPEHSANLSVSKKARIAGGVRTPTPKPKPTSKQVASTSKGSASTRRRPAVINDSDDDSDEEAEGLVVITKPKRLRKPNNNSPEHEDEDDGYTAGGGEPEDDDDNFDDDQDVDVSRDLRVLSGQELKIALRKEHPQWKAAAHSDDDFEDDIDIPDPNFCEATTASEVDPTAADDDEEDEDEGEPEGNQDDDDNDEDESQPHYRRMTQNGKRAADRRAEVPLFTTAAAGDEPSDDGSDSGPEGILDIDDEDPNEGWASAAHYTPPGRGKRGISIKAQPYVLRMVIKAAIRRVTGDAIGETAYPPLDDATKYFRQTLRRCAVSLGATLYASRFAQDHHFGVVFGRLLNGRLSGYRGGMKKVALSKVEGFYQLAGGAEGKAKVADLINQTSYIFPLRGELLVRTKPFFNLAIISTLREVFFMGTRGTLAEKHEDRFKTTSVYPTNMKRREVTAPMVALAATCVHSALDDFATGTCLKTEFNADLYEDVYHGHIKFLTEIRETNPEGYSKLMADLYTAASSAITRRTTTVANNALALLDIANMDV